MCHKLQVDWIKHTIKAPSLPLLPEKYAVTFCSQKKASEWSLWPWNICLVLSDRTPPGRHRRRQEFSHLEATKSMALPSLHTQAPMESHTVIPGFQLREGQMVLPPPPWEGTEEAGQESELPHSRLYHLGQEINLKTCFLLKASQVWNK